MDINYHTLYHLSAFGNEITIHEAVVTREAFGSDTIYRLVENNAFFGERGHTYYEDAINGVSINKALVYKLAINKARRAINKSMNHIATNVASIKKWEEQLHG